MRKKQFLSLSTLVLSAVSAVTLSLPSAHAATSEDAIAKQIQQKMLKCAKWKQETANEIFNQLTKLGFRRTFVHSAPLLGIEGEGGEFTALEESFFVVMERETPITFLGYPTSKFVFANVADIGNTQASSVSVLLPVDSFEKVKKYRTKFKEGPPEYQFFLDVRKDEEGVYVGCAYNAYITDPD